jgi:hypothetical protein
MAEVAKYYSSADYRRYMAKITLPGVAKGLASSYM